MSYRIFLVEDHPVVREGYASIIGRIPDLTVCGAAATAGEALEKIAASPPDLAIVDIGLPGMSGIELVRQLQVLHPDLLVLIVSAHDELLYGEPALRSGARGYLTKEEATDHIVEAIRAVLRGDRYLSDRLHTRLLDRYFHGGHALEVDPMETLTERELEVFRHIGLGRTTAEIAAAMTISPKTVESHRTNIKQKLGLETTGILVRRAVLWVEGLGRR